MEAVLVMNMRTGLTAVGIWVLYVVFVTDIFLYRLLPSLFCIINIVIRSRLYISSKISIMTILQRYQWNTFILPALLHRWGDSNYQSHHRRNDGWATARRHRKILVHWWQLLKAMMATLIMSPQCHIAVVFEMKMPASTRHVEILNEILTQAIITPALASSAAERKYIIIDFTRSDNIEHDKIRAIRVAEIISVISAVRKSGAWAVTIKARAGDDMPHSQ